MTGEGDRWSRWLLERRDAGDERQRSVNLGHLLPIRDRVLGHAEPLDGATLLDVGRKVKAAFAELEGPATAPMIDFDDRDLADLAEAAGFDRIHLECHIDVEPGSPIRATSLDALLDAAPNPLAPTIRESLSAALTPSEQDRFLAHLGRSIAEGDIVRRSVVAYLAARKPE